MTDNSQSPEKQKFNHDPVTGDILNEDGIPYGFQFFPQKNSKSERGKFITTDGRELIFRPMSRNVLLMFVQRFEKAHKPRIPKKPYDIGQENGKNQYSWESDPNDAAYLEELEEYNMKLGVVLAAMQVSMGLKFDVPSVLDWDIELQAMFEVAVDPESRYFEHERKYFYLMATLTEDEGECLLRLLQGMDMPTMEGIEIAENRFPRSGQ